MIPRGQLDISYTDIFAGIGYCLAHQLKPGTAPAPPLKNSFYSLSVRSAFDLILQALNYPPGTEILVTDISIPGMFQIMEAHQLVAVPLAVDKHSLSISPEQLKAAITAKSKAVIFTHLFGGLMELEELRELAKGNGLLVIEDCAQAYTGNSYTERSASDVLLFSFGMIKTNTALGGALVRINDQPLCEQVIALQHDLPEQKAGIYQKKLWQALLIKLFTTRFIYALFYRCLQALNKDPDEVLSGLTRGFPGAEMLKKIRFRPGTPLLRMLDRKQKNFDPEVIAKRRAFGLEILQSLPPEMQIGGKTPGHSFWVLPVETDKPEMLIANLRRAGFDATAKASSLVRMESLEDGADVLKSQRLVYLPVWVTMKEREKKDLIRVLWES